MNAAAINEAIDFANQRLSQMYESPPNAGLSQPTGRSGRTPGWRGWAAGIELTHFTFTQLVGREEFEIRKLRAIRGIELIGSNTTLDGTKGFGEKFRSPASSASNFTDLVEGLITLADGEGFEPPIWSLDGMVARATRLLMFDWTSAANGALLLGSMAPNRR